MRLVLLPACVASCLFSAGWAALRSVDKANRQVLSAKLQVLANSSCESLKLVADGARRELKSVAREIVSESQGIPQDDGDWHEFAERVGIFGGYHGFKLLAIRDEDRTVWANGSPVTDNFVFGDLPKLGEDDNVKTVFQNNWILQGEIAGDGDVDFSPSSGCFLGVVRIGSVTAYFNLRSCPFLELLRDAGTDLDTTVVAFDKQGIVIDRGDSTNDPALDEKPVSPLPIVESALRRRDVEGDSPNPVIDLDGYTVNGVDRVAIAQWLPEHQVGLLVEINRLAAMAPTLAARRALRWLFGLTIAATLFGAIGYLSSFLNQRRQAIVAKQRLGQYTLEEKIGEGAMGEVYRASHFMLQRPTAIKLLRPAKSSEEAITRFEQEVQLTSQLTHPNTIAIYDYGRNDEGIFYYSMEYLFGFNLESVVDIDGPQPPGRVVHLLSQACGSLHEAHTNGLIHRDIKPANIFECMRGGVADIVKVLDFGLVKNLADRDSSVVGTPAYMAPEALLNPLSVDVRSDVFSLGAIGYFLLTGKPISHADDFHTLLKRVRSGSCLDVQFDSCGERDSRLQDLIRDCLAASPSDRPNSAAELRRGLKKCPSIWSEDDAQLWWLKHGTAARTARENNRSESLLETIAFPTRS